MSKAAASSRVGGAPRCSPSANPNPNPDLNTAGDWNQNPSRRNPSNATTAKKQSDTASTSKSKETQLNEQFPPELSETGSEETELSCSEGDDSSWITWFCGLRGNELLCEVDEDYIRDDFNLCGLQGQVPYYDYALDMILDDDSLSAEVDSDEHSQIESAAELLYGLIHARYIITSKGLNAMHEKYKRVDFGRCPRVFVEGSHVCPWDHQTSLTMVLWRYTVQNAKTFTYQDASTRAAHQFEVVHCAPNNAPKYGWCLHRHNIPSPILNDLPFCKASEASPKLCSSGFWVQAVQGFQMTQDGLCCPFLRGSLQIHWPVSIPRRRWMDAAACD